MTPNADSAAAISVVLGRPAAVPNANREQAAAAHPTSSAATVPNGLASAATSVPTAPSPIIHSAMRRSGTAMSADMATMTAIEIPRRTAGKAGCWPSVPKRCATAGQLSVTSQAATRLSSTAQTIANSADQTTAVRLWSRATTTRSRAHTAGTSAANCQPDENQPGSAAKTPVSACSAAGWARSSSTSSPVPSRDHASSSPSVARRARKAGDESRKIRRPVRSRRSTPADVTRPDYCQAGTVASRRVARRLATVVTASTAAITISESPVEISGTESLCRWANSSTSLRPMNARIAASPVDR